MASVSVLVLVAPALSLSLSLLLSSLSCRLIGLVLVIFLSAATSPSSGWLTSTSAPAPINSNINSRRYRLYHSSSEVSRVWPVSLSSQLQWQLQSSLLPNSNENEEKDSSPDETNTGGISFSFTDQLRLSIGKRVGSGAYGTVHIAHLHNDIDIDSDVKRNVERYMYIVKRAWTLSEIEMNVPMAVMQLDDDDNNNNNNNTNNKSASDVQRTGLAQATGVAQEGSDDDDNDNKSSSSDKMKERAERCRYYWNVERHIVQKLASSSQMSRKDKDEQDEEGYSNCHVTPQFKGVFRSAAAAAAVDNTDNNEGGEIIVPGYGKIGTSESTTETNNIFSIINGGDSKEELQEWMVFEYIPSGSFGGDEESLTALTLLDAMQMDWRDDQHLEEQDGDNHHHLEDIATAMNLPSKKFGDTLDAIFVSILEDLKVIHASNIVHRDVKPSNLLCDGINNRLLLIDFGSAADLDLSSPAKPSQQNNVIGNIFFSNAAAGLQQPQQQRRVGFDEGIAPISPIYSAPETFIKLDENPLAFDVFSAALVMCQLLFNLLDEERTDAGFTQQLREADYDLDTWLENSLRAKLMRPLGFDDALEYLGERRGLWALLKQMLQPDPLNRISSSMALARLNEILALRSGEMDWSDETIALVAREEEYFESVIDSFGTISYGDGQDDSRPRPLHFLASFKAGVPAGLVLAEASGDYSIEDSDMSDEAKEKWKEATKFASPGEVFVRGWNTNGQADKLGIFEVGDRLRGVGELPFTNAGYEAAVDLIQRQPRSGGTLKLHFDRLSKLNEQVLMDQNNKGGHSFKQVVSQGTWKSKGRRGNQEDSFVLHEIKNDVSGDVLLAGVFDGHAGPAASESVSNVLPSLFREELLTSNGRSDSVIRESLQQSWRRTCDLYKNGCDENGECVVDYDPLEGILFAETGSIGLIAGTTATIAAISMNPNGANELTILNCGDSRTMLVGEPVIGDGSVVVFETRDHSPDDTIEIERLSLGKELGLDYSIPECSVSGSYLRVGDFQYALCRSLEGTYVTSKGIVSDPDITNINLKTALAGRQYNSLVLACDGLFEVMSSEEVGKEAVLMRKAGYKADEVAKNLCGQALKKGSYDNISVIVLHLGDA